MTNVAEILKRVRIGLHVALFLLKTDRGLQATALCNECVILLQSLDSGIYRDLSEALFNAYCTISDYTNAARCTTELIDLLF